MSDWILERGLEILRRAQTRIGQVEELLRRRETDRAESVARESLATFASAMNWLEDTPEFDRAHRLLDDAGKYVRLTFGCSLHQEADRYEQRCPVAISHKRIGVSPELLIHGFDCTVCGQDAESCEHIAGGKYGGQICARRPREIEVLGIAWVSRPEQPDARLQSVPIDVDQLKRALPSGWKPGMPVSCDRCLSSCGGVEEFDFRDLNSAIDSPEEGTSTFTVALMLANTPRR
jgi:hypothetical protein